MDNREDLPVKILSLGITAYSFYSIGSLLNPYAEINELIGWIVAGMAISYSFTFVGMKKYGKRLDTNGIYKLASFIALIYLFNTPTVYSTFIDKTVDSRYSIIKKEYAMMPVFDPAKVNSLKEKQIEIVNRYKEDIKDSYSQYIKEDSKAPNYSYYSSARKDRDKMKSLSEKRVSKYTIAVAECQGYDLSTKSKAVAECQKDIAVKQLKATYEKIKNASMKSNSIYYIDNIPHTHIYQEEIKANSYNASESKRNDLKKELENMESKSLLPMWAVGLILYLIGFIGESRIANMSVFAEADMKKRELKGEMTIHNDLENKKSETVKKRLENERENINALMSSSDSMLRFLHNTIFINDFKDFDKNKTLLNIRRKHATFFAVIKAIMIENPTHLGKQQSGFSERIIQSHVSFNNPKRNMPFRVKDDHIKVREIIEKNKGAKRVNGEWIFDFIALRKILIEIDKYM